MSELENLMSGFSRRGSQPLTGDDMVRVLQTLAQLAESARADRQFIEALQARLQIVDELPADAPFGALIRRRTGTVGERATVYTGNGPGQPLARLVPTALP